MGFTFTKLNFKIASKEARALAESVAAVLKDQGELPQHKILPLVVQQVIAYCKSSNPQVQGPALSRLLRSMENGGLIVWRHDMSLRLEDRVRLWRLKQQETAPNVEPQRGGIVEKTEGKMWVLQGVDAQGVSRKKSFWDSQMDDAKREAARQEFRVVLGKSA